MVCDGLGVWVARTGSARLWLYHTETYRLIQSVDLAGIIRRGMSADKVTNGGSMVRKTSCSFNSISGPLAITSLESSEGFLWVGTSQGLALTLPLPRLASAPCIYTSANIAFHAHQGPVR